VLLLGGNRVGPSGGLALLRAVEESPRLHRIELCREIPRPTRRRIQAIAAARAASLSAPPPQELRAIQSVYRTARRPPVGRPEVVTPEPAPSPAPPDSPTPDAAALEQAAATLEALAANPALFFEDRRYARVRAAANRLVDSLVREARRRRSSRPAPASPEGQTRAAQRARDRALTAAAAIRVQRAGSAPEEIAGAAAPHYARARTCHICGGRFTRTAPPSTTASVTRPRRWSGRWRW
jgi:hypothetical protein